MRPLPSRSLTLRWRSTPGDFGLRSMRQPSGWASRRPSAGQSCRRCGRSARWKAGRCDVGREHFATEGVRAWLARQAFLAPPPFRPHPIVLACGPQDLHTIGLESFAVILARRGWPCRVLGEDAHRGACLRGPGHGSDRCRRDGAASVTRRSAMEAIAAADALGVRAFYAGDAFVAPSARKDVRGYLGEDLVEAARVVESSTS